ncbi:hypothetical protein Hanom_Chr12g01101521 [Helianthus anomalus]
MHGLGFASCLPMGLMIGLSLLSYTHCYSLGPICFIYLQVLPRMMSNVYGTLGQDEEVSDVRLNMRQQNVKKTPGCSWIEFGDGMHVFGTGDRAHPDEDSIYSELNSLYMSIGLCHMT